jgi:hypothetical protein
VRTRVRGDGGVTGCVESACLERSGSVPSGTGGLGTAARPDRSQRLPLEGSGYQGDRCIGRREFITLVGGAAVCRRAQQAEGFQEFAWDSRASGRDLF